MSLADNSILNRLADPSVRGEWTPQNLLGNTLKRHSAPFTVYQAKWNPCTDVIALASEKGEINTRRRIWKRAWKTSLGEMKPLPHQQSDTDDSSKLRSICWSPCGMFLAVGFRNGVLHLLDRERGYSVYSVSLGCTIRSMRWTRLSSTLKTGDDDRLEGLVSELSVKNVTKLEKTDALERLVLLRGFCDGFVKSELPGTALLVVDEENSVHVLAAGVLPVLCIKPPMEYFDKCDPYSITVGDVYVAEQSQLLVAYSSIGESTAPKPNEGIAFGYNTQIVKFDIDFVGWFKNGSVWKITHRWLRLFYSVCCISDAFSRMTLDWEEQSEHFHKAFEKIEMKDTDGHPLTVAECFIGRILHGDSEVEMQRYFRELTELDWRKMKDWVGKSFSKLVTFLKSELWAGVELYQHHLKRFVIELEHATQLNKSTSVLPKRIFDVDIYPYGGYGEQPEDSTKAEALKDVVLSAEKLYFKVSELVAVATQNRRELLNFIRWLSFTPGLKDKNPTGDRTAWVKYDLAEVLEYISDVFGLPDKRSSPGSSEQINDIHEKSGLQILTNTTERGLEDAPEQAIEKDPESIDSGKRVISFDQVVDYFNPSDDLKSIVDLKSNDFRSPDSDETAKGLAKMTLAQCVKNSVTSLDAIRAHLLSVCAPMVTPTVNIFLEQTHPDGFKGFDFFPFMVPESSVVDETTRSCLKRKFGSAAVPALSCIGSNGHRHCVYSASGELITCSVFDDRCFEKRRSDISQGPVALNDQTSTHSSASAVDEPLSVETTAALPAVSPNAISSASNCRMIQFESLDNGTYFGLIRAKRGGGELTYVFRSYFGNKTFYVHEEQSTIESFERIIVSESRRLGIAILEPQYTINGSRLRWFEFENDTANILLPKRTVLGEVDGATSLVLPYRSGTAACPQELDDLNEGDNFDLDLDRDHDHGHDHDHDQTSSSLQLRRSGRKRKPVRS